MWKKDRDALYYSSKNSGGKRSAGGKKSYTRKISIYTGLSVTLVLAKDLPVQLQRPVVRY